MTQVVMVLGMAHAVALERYGSNQSTIQQSWSEDEFFGCKITHLRALMFQLRNDHRELTEKINQNIQILHSARLPSGSSTPNELGNDDGLNNQNLPFVNAVPSASSPNAMDVDLMVSVPYAFVDVIADASPAAEDGLQLGDQIVKFGNVEAGENLSQRLLSEAQTNQGCAIPVVVMRQGALINLTVTPRTWQGRGLLGYVCHLL
ncbi:uncharacterized protein LOC132185545 [Corylus avellana]|uniref:uncharacterized protein LOC132185545 n=1 Tax=Corylus avellana TaxID=13451 RepID=UPI00286CDF06|nr:uncharacterized protein LOC132185545 [Corylus avellana]